MNEIIKSLIVIIVFGIYPIIIFFGFFEKKYISKMFGFARIAIITLFTILFVCLVCKTALDSIGYFVVSILSYFVIVIVEKKVITHKLLKQFNYTKTKFLSRDSFKLMPLSPDYMFTYYAKNNICNSLEESDRLNALAYFIKTSNLLNIIISFSLTVILLYAKLEELFFLFEFLKGIMIFRMISRAIEIIISFISDIMQNKHNSSLKYNERIQLALFSLLEVLFMTFSLNVIFLCKNESVEIFNLLFDSIKNLFNFPLKDSTCIDINYNVDVKYTIQILEYLTSYSLLGIVLSSYISSKKSIKISRRHRADDKQQKSSKM